MIRLPKEARGWLVTMAQAVMPLGTSKDELPIDAQLIGPYWSEPELLHIARRLAPLTQGVVAPQGF
jgi:Asp-tRNA(Asn)/Glu-tRNA(Gln) amidotransferase A subunit family amidase